VVILIRTDASIFIGSGHVMRCLVLAQALKSQNHTVIFATRPQPGDMIEYIRAKGFLVHELIQPLQWQSPSYDADYQSWLQVPWQVDAESLLSKISTVDLLLVDHYGLNKAWEHLVQQELECKVFVIDDLVREHQCDLILDQTLMRRKEEYQAVNKNTKILTGCEYSLLNPLFSHYRTQILDDALLPSIPHILVSMGGVDRPNATLRVLEAFALHPQPKPQITVLLGPKAPHYLQVKGFCEAHKSWISHFDFSENMAELMLEHSFAIGAPGTTSWERACLGIPSIIVPLADNQKVISENLVKAKAAIKVELGEIASNLLGSYYLLVKQYFEYRATNLKLCDGLGLQRVVQQMKMLFKNRNQLIKLRKATKSDIKQVFDWQCQPETRKYALNSDIPNWEGHLSWMSNKLSKTEDFFYILKLISTNERIGVVRLDKIKKSEYLISIFVDSKHYGKGIAKQALANIDMLHSNIIIHATVLEENLASQKLFTSANYQQISESTFIRPPVI